MNSIAFEMGAVFLLAGMLMLASAHGLIPRSLRNIGAPILVGVVLAGFLIWRFGPDLYANARSNAAPWFAASWFATAEPAQAEAHPAGPAPSGKAPATHRAKLVTQDAKAIVIREVVSAPAEATPPAVAVSETPVAEEPIAAKPVAAKPIPPKSVDDAVAKPAPESSGSSPYDSGVKRAVKSVGRFLHIGGKKEQPAQ
jgi:hypothetical protein